jgi:hypothetical protein
MGDGATCAWAMTPEQIKEWNDLAEECGFATVEQQERLGRIYDAIKDTLKSLNEGPYGEQSDYTGRRFSVSDYLLVQDDSRVIFQWAGAVGFVWKPYGEFEAITPELRGTFEMGEIVAEALGRLA